MGLDESYAYEERQKELSAQQKNGGPTTTDIHIKPATKTIQDNNHGNNKHGLYIVREQPGRGMGCFATRKIPRGTRILSEAPLLTLPRFATDVKSVEKGMLAELKSLDKEQQRAFFALANAHLHGGVYGPVIGITMTNAIPFGSGGADGGIFPRAARINHACKPNSQNVWNENRKELTIHAFKDIAAGEEITIAYVDAMEVFAARKERLEGAFGFACACETCDVSPEQTRARDAKLKEMARLDAGLGNGRRIMSKPLECLHDAHTVYRMLRDEGVAGARISRVYNDALQIVIAHGDQARAKVFAERAHEVRLVLEGEDSPEVARLQKLIEKPSSHGLFDSSKTWAQPVTAIPRDLSDDDFTDWLWRLKGGLGLPN